MQRRGIVLMIVMALIVTVGAGIAAAARAGSGKIIRTEGANYFEANAFIQSTLRFSPDLRIVLAGGSVRLQHRDMTFEPHTLTVVNQDDLPTSVEEVFACQEPGQVCGDALEGHFGEGIKERLEDDDDGEFGLDGPGDSILVLDPGGSIDSAVTAPAGTRLFFLCAIHPWMQAEIKVSSG
jgi:hypothetical protein